MAWWPRSAPPAAPCVEVRSTAGAPASLTGDVDQLAEAVAARVLVDGTGELRALCVLGLGVGALTDVTVVVAGWRRPVPGWTGRLGHVPQLARAQVELPTGREGAVSVQIVLQAPADLAAVARAVLPLLEPVRADSRRGAPRVAVAPGTPSGVAALFTDPRVAPVRIEPEPAAIRGNDVLLRGPDSAPVPDDQVARTIEVDGDGTLLPDPGASDRSAPAGGSPWLPQIDLTTHRPAGRLRSTAAGVRAELHAHADGWSVEPVAGSAAEAVAVLVPAGRPLDAHDVCALRRVTSLDLSTVPVPPDDPSRRRLSARLAELASVGIELHDGGALSPVAVGLDRTLAQLIGLPRSDKGLARALRTTRQRRAATVHHGGALRLAQRLSLAGSEHADVPSVSVLLVSRRPDQLPVILSQIAAQTYPNLEVVVVVHGGPRFEVPQSLRPLVSHSVAVDASVPFGEVLAHATTLADGELLTKVDDDDFYGPHHVWDLVLAWLSSGAQVVGKRAQYVYVAERDLTVHRKLAVETYVKVVAGGTMLLSAADLASVGGWRPVPRSVDRGLLERLHEAGGCTYATEGLGYLYVRHGDGHTWAVDADDLLSGALEQWPGIHTAVLDDGPIPLG